MLTMEQPNLPTNQRFADMVASAPGRTTPVWAKNSRTTLAHTTGRLPERAKQIGWQPFAGPGAAPSARPMSTSMRSLRRRVVRGEA
jgi:hypothetical protein